MNRSRWDELDEATRAELDRQFLDELPSWAQHGLTEEGVRVYLEFRREHPGRAITTFEEGRIRKLLRRYVDPSKVPDPVDLEDHIGRLEQMGAQRFHFTNAQTYVAFMVAGTLGLIIVFLVALYLM